jgi:hypothetical protein
MRQLLFLSLIMVSASFMECSSQPPKSPRVSAEGKDVKVAYGQPSKRGRVIFGNGGLEPYGKVWRTGANEATEITFAKDATFGGQAVKAGTYTLFTIPNENEWTVILNPELKQWGAYGYDKIKSKDLPHITVPARKLDSPVEKLTLKFDDKNSLVIEWDQTHVEVPIQTS